MCPKLASRKCNLTANKQEKYNWTMNADLKRQKNDKMFTNSRSKTAGGVALIAAHLLFPMRRG